MRGSNSLTLAAVLGLAGLAAALPLCAQYPGQVAKSSKVAPTPRAISVLEWTGEAGKPKSCRLVPVALLDQGVLQDGGVYLARPQPLALAGEVEYELEQNGQPMGLFDVENTGQEQGSWVGYGSWKPLPTPKAKPSMDELAKLTVNDEDSDRPVLHRKHHADDAPAAGKGDSTSDGPPPADDPDRPKLHKKESSDDSASASAPPDDPDRPVLKKEKKKKPQDVGHVDSLPGVTDPDRPQLKRGKPVGYTLNVIPSLMGLPPDMKQAVAVSDSKDRPAHPWAYSWANPDDEAKMKAALEDVARDARGLKPALPAPKRATNRKKLVPPVEPLPPAPLTGEQFRVFELAYGSGATLVLTAHTDGTLAEQKFVTLIAQPDFYGNALVLLKYVAYGANLDETPRMRLVDAVDVLADNRGELLFELRGATGRQFALYRVLRGRAEKLFVTSGGEVGVASSEY
jgi:hypothetical protein